MGRLSIISVGDGFYHFHSACHFEYDDLTYANGWLGFGPSIHNMPVTTLGKVFTEDESARVDYGITLAVPDARLSQAARETKAQYSSEPYVVTVRDCVSFSADVARRCGLGVPVVFNFTPYGLIQSLAVWNPYERKW